MGPLPLAAAMVELVEILARQAEGGFKFSTYGVSRGNSIWKVPHDFGGIARNFEGVTFVSLLHKRGGAGLNSCHHKYGETPPKGPLSLEYIHVWHLHGAPPTYGTLPNL